MKALLLALALVGTSFSAEAAYLLQQKDDGTAVFENSRTGRTVQVNETWLTLEIPDVSSAATHTIGVPFEGIIDRVYVTFNNTLSGTTPKLNMFIANGASANQFRQVSPADFMASASNDIYRSAGLAENSPDDVGSRLNIDLFTMDGDISDFSTGRVYGWKVNREIGGTTPFYYATQVSNGCDGVMGNYCGYDYDGDGVFDRDDHRELLKTGSTIAIVSDGASTGPTSATVMIVIDR